MKFPGLLLSLVLAASAPAASVLSNTGNAASAGTAMSSNYMMMGGMPPMFMSTGTAVANSFTTSNVPLTVDSVSLLISNASGTGNFSVAFYSDNTGNPGSSLVALTGVPPVNGENIFSTAPGGYAFEANTTYWLVTSIQSMPMPFYSLTLGDTTDLSETSGDGWTIGTKVSQFNTGVMNNSWNADPSTAIRFSLNAVPEPASAALVLLSGGLLLRRNRRRIAA